MAMLKVKAIHDEPGELRVYEVLSDGVPASSEELDRVARIANQLVDENRIGGRFAAAANGTLELHIAPAKRTFFHDGIVFAALDAVNDPVRSPTLTRFAAGVPNADDDEKGRG